MKALSRPASNLYRIYAHPTAYPFNLMLSFQLEPSLEVELLNHPILKHPKVLDTFGCLV